MIEIITFDLDGTIIDTEKKMWVVNFKKAAKELGYEMRLAFHQSLMGVPLKDSYGLFADEFGKDFPTDKFLERVYELNEVMLQNGDIPIMPGVKELLEFLKTTNIKVCIGTSTPHERAVHELKIVGLYDYFDLIVGGDDIKNGKPNPDIYLKPMEYFNIPLENGLVFEDGHAGARAAINANIRLVLVPDIAILSDEDKAQAFKVINRIDDIIDIIKQENNL